MEVIVEREQYRIAVDRAKNRLLFEAWGDLIEAGQYKHIPDDWRTACSQVKPGFSVLGDYSRVGVHFMKRESAEGMKVVFDAGVKKVAVFWGVKVLGRWTTEQAAAEASDQYAAKRRSFENREEAEAWLED
jgi:hypothetical protein